MCAKEISMIEVFFSPADCITRIARSRMHE